MIVKKIRLDKQNILCYTKSRKQKGDNENELL